LLDKNLKLKKIIGPYQSWEYMKEKYERNMKEKVCLKKLTLLKNLSLFKKQMIATWIVNFKEIINMIKFKG